MSQFNHVAIDIHVRCPGVPQAFAQDGTCDRVPDGDTLLWGAETTQAISGPPEIMDRMAYSYSLKGTMDRLEKCDNRNLLKYRKEKCKVLHVVRNNPVANTDWLGSDWLESRNLVSHVDTMTFIACNLNTMLITKDLVKMNPVYLFYIDAEIFTSVLANRLDSLLDQLVESRETVFKDMN
ncbi:hypothetical protein TURU_024920 [Turdus rufiventris]|nr:hypothetical protein TURU_024920 [Turdus rufiventris]